MKKLISVVLSLMILVLSLSAGTSAMAAQSAAKYGFQKKQYNSQSSTFNFDGKKSVKLVYDEAKNNYIVYLSNKVTKKGKVLFRTKDYTALAINGNYVYYAEPSKGAIMRRNIKTKKAKKLVSFKKKKYNVQFLLCGERLVYNLKQYKNGGELKKSFLYVTNLKGKKPKLIAKNVDSNMFSYNFMLYFTKGKNLMRYSFKEGTLGKRNVGLDMTNAKLIGMENKTLYIAYIKGTAFNECNFYKADVEKQRYWKFESVKTDDPIHGLMVFESKAYITTGTGAGTAFAAVTGERADFQTYENRDFTVCGDNLAFYRNSIVLDNYDVNSKTNDYTFKQYMVKVNLK